MSGPAVSLLIAVPAALVAAASFGLTGALQHRAARATGTAGAVRLGLIGDLLRQPLWLLSLLFNAVGVGMQWVALSTGPLALIQSLLVMGLMFGVVSTSMLYRVLPDRTVMFGAALCVAGLAAFLVLARPTAGNDRLSVTEVLPLAVGLAVVLAGCLTVAVRRRGPVRVLALSTATGVLYGVTAGLAKLAADEFRHGVLAALSDWPLYLVLVCGPLGFLLNQNAFRAGVALAPALAVIIVLDPLVGIGIGLLWLGEQINAGPLEIIGELVSFAVLTTGVIILSRRAPQAAMHLRQDGQPCSDARAA